jgi:hypothetical protein
VAKSNYLLPCLRKKLLTLEMAYMNDKVVKSSSGDTHPQDVPWECTFLTCGYNEINSLGKTRRVTEYVIHGAPKRCWSLEVEEPQRPVRDSREIHQTTSEGNQK